MLSLARTHIGIALAHSHFLGEVVDILHLINLADTQTEQPTFLGEVIDLLPNTYLLG